MGKVTSVCYGGFLRHYSFKKRLHDWSADVEIFCGGACFPSRWKRAACWPPLSDVRVKIFQLPD